MSGYSSRDFSLYFAPRCRVCGRGARDAVALDGAVCGACLRRMNADPVAKRRLILGSDQFDW